MKEGAAAKCAALLVLVAAASLHLHAATAARRLEALSGPGPNPCTSDPSKPGNMCHGPPGQQAAARADQSPPLVRAGVKLAGQNKANKCSHDPNDPRGTKCISPPNAP